MSRLTNGVREAMARALVKHKMADQAKALEIESAALFKTVWEHEYPEAVRKAIAAIGKLRPNGLVKKASIRANVRGMSIGVGADVFGIDGLRFNPKVEPLPFLDDLNWNGVPFTDCALADRLEKFAKDRSAFVTELSQSYKKAMGTLGQFTTGKKLASEWPEAMPIIGHMILEENRTLPAVQLGDFNKDFGLPPSEKLAA